MKFKFMFHGALLSLILFSGVVLDAEVKTKNSDLWERSLVTISNNGIYLPREFHYQSYVLDHTGELFRSFEADCTIGWNGDIPGLLSSTLAENSETKGVSDESEWRDEISNALHFLHLKRPFFVESSPVLLSETPKLKFLNGVQTLGFDFEMEMEGLLVKGTSWIDPDDALPRQVELRITNFEFQNEDKKVIHYYRTIDYQIEKGIWAPHMLTESIWFTRRSMLKNNLFVEEKKFDLGGFGEPTP